MLILKFEMEFLTPTFLGSDRSNVCEFSLKPLKSLMRYWWRQAQDRTSGIEELFKKESSIFGYTEKASSFMLYLEDDKNINYDTSEKTYSPQSTNGTYYLFYTCVGRGPRQPGKTHWILPGSKAKFGILCKDSEVIQQILLSLWLAQTFSGLGTRSRRGAGAFQIVKFEAPEKIMPFIEKLFFLTAKDLISMVRKEKTEIKEIVELVNQQSPFYLNAQNSERFKEYPDIHRPNMEGLLEDIGLKMRDFRTHRSLLSISSQNFFNEASCLHSAGLAGSYSGPPTLKKTAFGLPITYRFSGENFSIIAKPENHERQASPLFITIKKDNDNKYYANLFCLWDNNFLPGKIQLIKEETKERKINGEKKKIKVKKNIGSVNMPDSEAIEKFLRSL